MFVVFYQLFYLNYNSIHHFYPFTIVSLLNLNSEEPLITFSYSLFTYFLFYYITYF